MSAFLPNIHSLRKPLLTLFAVKTCMDHGIIILIIAILSFLFSSPALSLTGAVCVRNATPSADRCLAFVTVIVPFSLECGGHHVAFSVGSSPMLSLQEPVTGSFLSDRPYE